MPGRPHVAMANAPLSATGHFCLSFLPFFLSLSPPHHSPGHLAASCSSSELEPWLGFCGWRQGRHRGRALIAIQGSPQFAGAINLRKSPPWAVRMHRVLWEGVGSREAQTAGLEINGICSPLPHPDLVISWGHREKKNHLYTDLVFGIV